ncbi:MAG: DUF885 domain-containing protein, partial [Myxococcaceae bacterium]|nr:DUF885 domain-containing protein [Myxococcaceae bacterium]
MTGLAVRLAAVCWMAVALPAQADTPKAARTASRSEAQKLKALIDEQWQWTLREYPTWATALGDSRYNDRWPDLSLEAVARRHQHERELLTRITALDRAKLSPGDQLNYDLFALDARLDVEAQRFPSELLPINQMGGVYSELADVAQQAPRRSVKDYEDFLRRMRTFPTLVEQTVARMRKGLERGLTPPRITVR